MNNEVYISRSLCRITCSVHERLSHIITKKLIELDIKPVFVESGRSVRQFVRPRPFHLPGKFVKLERSPLEIYSFTISSKESKSIINLLINEAEINFPGNGDIFSQSIIEHYPIETKYKDDLVKYPLVINQGSVKSNEKTEYTLHKNLSLLIFILSMPGSGDELAREVLELGACVPVITMGIGTGLRDRLGLLRITIPPEKEIVHLLVPKQDDESIMKLMIEELRLNRPGRGFIYSSPVDYALVDTRIHSGKQEHAASIEQIIAAIDELKSGTAWRKRFISNNDFKISKFIRKNQEMTIFCMEGQSDEIIRTCLEMGVGGATVSRVKKILDEDNDTGIAAYEKIVINAPTQLSGQIVEKLFKKAQFDEDYLDRIQIISSPAVFTHHE